MSIWTDFQGGGVAERYYQAGDIRTRTLEAGEGGERPLLLLHGTTGHAEAYHRNLAPLSRDRRVLAVDMLGHGYTDRPDLDYTPDDYADHILALVDAIGAERVDISGESLGAMVAAWFAIKYPERVGGIIMSTGLLSLSPPEARGDIQRAIALTQAVTDDLTKDTVRKRMEFLVSKPERMTDELVDVRYTIYTQPGMPERLARTMATVLSWIAGDAGQEYLQPGVHSRVSCPAVVLWTSHNPLWTTEQARAAAAAMPNGRFELIEDCGHWPQFEQPEATNELHRSFFAGVAGVSRGG
jgi:2-hydroxy-6-oxonona-2,4-dienedioate hydrolase